MGSERTAPSLFNLNSRFLVKDVRGLYDLTIENGSRLRSAKIVDGNAMLALTRTWWVVKRACDAFVIIASNKSQRHVQPAKEMNA